MSATAAIREPNFFLVGASRAGTTSLWQYLVAHPDIFMPRRALAEKEPSHFCEVTPRWATKYKERQQYLRLFDEAGTCAAVGEASTPYLVAPEVPGRLRAAYPDAKIIIVLRNPTDRAFSLYRYLCLIGGESVPTFEKALDIERARMADAEFRRTNPLWHSLFEYYHSGLYSAQVARYLEAFPREQIEIILYDDLAADSLATAQRVFRFLGVAPDFVPKIERYNESLFPFSVRLQYWLGHDMDRSAEGRIGPVKARLFITNMRLGKWRTRTFNPDTRQRLRAAYREDIAKTAALIGRPLDHWLEIHERT